MYSVEAYIIFGQFVLNRSSKNVFHISYIYDQFSKTTPCLHLINMYYLLTFTFFTQCFKGVRVSLYLFSVKPEDVQLTTNVTSNKACLNDVVFFNCSAANANPPVALYQFFENDTLFGSSSSGMFSKMVMNSGNLTYKCVANNTAGTTSSQNVSITVNGEANNDYIKKIECVLFYLLFACFCQFPSCFKVYLSSLSSRGQFNKTFTSVIDMYKCIAIVLESETACRESHV